MTWAPNNNRGSMRTTPDMHPITGLRFDLSIALADLGWSQAELGRRLGISANSIGIWVKTRRAPQYARAYIELALAVRGLIDRIS